MIRTWFFRIAVLLVSLQCLGLSFGFVPSANASWRYLGYFQTGTSWGHLVVQHKFSCTTQARGTYVYYSTISNYSQAAAEATKRCK